MTPNDLTSRIRQEALRQFAERGFDGTSMRDVANALGISPGNLTYHYPKKLDLFTAAIEGTYATFLADIKAAAASPGCSARERLRALLERLHHPSAAERQMLRAGMRELVSAPEHLAPVVHLFRSGHPLVLMGAVQAAIAEGALPKGVGLGVVPIIMATLIAAPMVARAAVASHPGFDFVEAAVSQSYHDLLVLLGFEP